MEIKVGKKYKRVRIVGGIGNTTFIGQIVTVLSVDEYAVEFEKVWKDGFKERGCSQGIKRFSANFIPLIVSLENK